MSVSKGQIFLSQPSSPFSILRSSSVWQQGVTSSVFQDRHRYLVNADVLAEVINFIISMSVKYYTIRIFSNAELSFRSSRRNHAVETFGVLNDISVSSRYASAM